MSDELLYEGPIRVGDWFVDQREGMHFQKLKVIDVTDEGYRSKRYIYLDTGDQRRSHYGELVFRTHFRPVTFQPDRPNVCAICDQPVTPEDYWSHTRRGGVVLTHMSCFVDTVVALGRERLCRSASKEEGQP